jgi:hypothetical protein
VKISMKIKEQSLSKNRKYLKCLILSNLFFTSIGYGFYYVTSKGYPLFGFMTAPIGRFDDFYNSLFPDFSTGIETKGNFLLAPAYMVIMKIFSLFEIQIAALLFFIIFLGYFFYVFGKFSNSLLFLLFLVTSYPLQFSIARGNNEFILAALTAVIYNSLLKKKVIKSFRYFMLQMFIEASYPVYLFQFITYFTSIKRYFIKKYFVVLIVIVGLVLFKPFRTYVEEFIFRSLLYGTSSGPGTALHSSSLSGVLQYLFLLQNGEFPYNATFYNILIKSFFWSSVLILFLFILKYRKKIDLITTSLLIPSFWTIGSSISYDYRLVYFFIPVVLILLNEIKPHDKYLLILISALFAPKPYILLTAQNNSLGETLGSIINPIIILAIITVTFMRFFKIPSMRKNSLPKKTAKDFNKKKKRH